MSRGCNDMKRLAGDRRGSTSIEFGVIATLMFSLIFGVFDLGRYYYIEHSLRSLASESLRYFLSTAPLGTNTPVTQQQTCYADWSNTVQTKIETMPPVAVIDPSKVTFCVTWGQSGATSLSVDVEYVFAALSPLWTGLNGNIKETATISY